MGTNLEWKAVARNALVVLICVPIWCDSVGALNIRACAATPGFSQYLWEIQAANYCEEQTECVQKDPVCAEPLINRAEQDKLRELRASLNCFDGIYQCIAYLPHTYDIRCVNKRCKRVWKTKGPIGEQD